jgi:hypothetical protein
VALTWLPPMVKRATARCLIAALAVPLVAADAAAQSIVLSADCLMFGACVPPATTNILGLPNGTLQIVDYEPWDRVVKGKAAAAWAPIEAEARAALAALHGVPNDKRLPLVAVDELRAMILLRLLGLAAKEAKAEEPLTSLEREALDMFKQVVTERRVAPAQAALDEYYKWSNNPCAYVVPANFGFDPYDPGPACNVVGGGLGSLAGPPRPPTAQQFTAYGAAVDLLRAGIAGGGTSSAADAAAADAQAAFDRFDEAGAFATAVSAAIGVSLGSTILAANVSQVAFAFAAMAGSWGGFGTVKGAAAAAFTTTAGIGTAAALPAIIIIAVVVTAIGTIQFVEDAQILPELQRTLQEARNTPDIVAMAAAGFPDSGVLQSAFMQQTLPDYRAERAYRASVAFPVPQQWAAGDPQFEIDGVAHPVIAHTDQKGFVRETFMAGGWFVTRVKRSVDAPWSAWEWTLSVDYLPPNALHHRRLGIQPSGFLDVEFRGATPQTRKVTEVTGFFNATANTIKWKGNVPPVVAPTASDGRTAGQPVEFKAAATDPDGTTAPSVTWTIDTVGDVVGDTTTVTFPAAGSYGTRVRATDANGATTTQQFLVTVGAANPTLTATLSPMAIQEGSSVRLQAQVNLPPQTIENKSGYTNATLTDVVVDWGDGTTTKRTYPCTVPGMDPVYSDVPTCPIAGGDLYLSGGVLTFTSYYPADTNPGPWTLDLTHQYTFRPNVGMPTAPQVKVTAKTRTGSAAPPLTFNVAVTNVVPNLFLPFGCTFDSILCPALADYRDVVLGTAVKVSGEVVDVPATTPAIKVFWGDGTSSALLPDCADAGCPSTAVAEGDTPDRKRFRVEHRYARPGSYTVRVLADTGGPGGQKSVETQVRVFGLAGIDGPDEATVGTPVSFTYQATLFGGVVPTATCEGGALAQASASGFTCDFADVADVTTRQVSAAVTVADTAYTATKTVTVRPRPASVASLTGPQSVVEGATHTYTYGVVKSPFATLSTVPTCPGVITDSTTVSFTCRFSAVTAASVGAVRVDLVDGATVVASRSLDVAIARDTEPPAMTVPNALVVPSTSNAGAIVQYAATAVDAISGAALVICTPSAGSLFPIGTTTVTCTANDWKSNQATAEFAVTVADATPPTLTLPAPVAVDATSAAGAVVTFAATAVDVQPAAPSVSCLPASGSTFPVGTTTVACEALDMAGNRAAGQFTVTVRGAATQIDALAGIIAAMAIAPQLKTQLLGTLLKARIGLEAGNTAVACSSLAQLLKQVTQAQKAGQLSPSEAQQITSEANRLRAVIGC